MSSEAVQLLLQTCFGGSKAAQLTIATW